MRDGKPHDLEPPDPGVSGWIAPMRDGKWVRILELERTPLGLDCTYEGWKVARRGAGAGVGPGLDCTYEGWKGGRRGLLRRANAVGLHL